MLVLYNHANTNNSFINEQLLIYGCHIDDVITSLRRGSEIFFQIKAKTSLKFLNIYDKHDDFDFDKVKFPFSPSHLLWSVYFIPFKVL